MELQNYKVEELTVTETTETEGGFLDILLSAVALTGAIYGAGYACGEAYYYYTHK